MNAPDDPIDHEHTAPVEGAAQSAGANDAPESAPSGEDEPASKKEQILALRRMGMDDVEELALLVQARPSYVAGVLQEAGEGGAYFDLYTSTTRPMNVYSRHFAGKLGFRDVAAAEASVGVIDRLYRRFAVARDRAGQHHALLMALTMFDRARWTGKADAAEPFRRWLRDHLDADEGER